MKIQLIIASVVALAGCSTTTQTLNSSQATGTKKK